MTDTERIDLLEKQVAELQEFARSLVAELRYAYVNLESDRTSYLVMERDYLFQEKVETFSKESNYKTK